MKETTCSFCSIIEGESHCFKVFENKNTLAFLDIDPISKGHTLVVPKTHAYNIFDIETKDLQEIIKVAQNIAQSLKREFFYETVSLMQTSGRAQDVPHFHLHIFGRNSRNDIKIEYPRNEEKLNNSQIQAIADKLKKSVQDTM